MAYNSSLAIMKRKPLKHKIRLKNYTKRIRSKSKKLNSLFMKMNK